MFRQADLVSSVVAAGARIAHSLARQHGALCRTQLGTMLSTACWNITQAEMLFGPKEDGWGVEHMLAHDPSAARTRIWPRIVNGGFFAL